MLISELIHRLTTISRKHGDLELFTDSGTEIVEAKMKINTENNKKQVIIMQLSELKDQLA